MGNSGNFCGGCGKKLCGTEETSLAKNTNENTTLENDLGKPSSNNIRFSNSNRPNSIATDSSFQSPYEKAKLIVSVNKIIRQFRKYKKRIEPKRFDIKHSLNKVPSEYFTKSDLNYIGDKDEQGRKQGFGIQKLKGGKEYIGYYKDDVFNGYGKISVKNGGYYKGEFKKGKANGYGEYIHDNGSKCYGIWEKDLRNGIGYEIWGDESTYEGEYDNDKKEGLGTYIFSEQQNIYQGEWNNNKMEGYGILTYSKGRKYSGQWKNFRMHGYGEFEWEDGKKYYGFYNYDKRDGFGAFFWPPCKYYIGFFKNGKQHGLAKCIKDNFVMYSYWENGTKLKVFNDVDEFVEQMEPSELKYKCLLMKSVEEIKLYMNNA